MHSDVHNLFHLTYIFAQNALNIVPLTPNVTEVTPVGSNQIVIALNTSDKKFK